MTVSLIQPITNLGATQVGINIFEQAPVTSISGTSTNIVAIVGHFPWGPEDTIEEITDTASFFSTFCPLDFGALDDFSALDCLLNKSFGGVLKVSRISPSAQAAASSGTITAGTGTVTLTADYTGSLGNDISYEFTAATDADAAKRNIIIRLGASYEVEYENVTFTTITDISNDYVTFTSATPSAMPAVAGPTNLTSGSDGTAVAADYTGGTGNEVGAELFKASSFDFLFCSEVPSAIIDSVNTGLDAMAAEISSGLVVLSTPAGQTRATALTYAASYRDPRAVYPWPLQYTSNRYSSGLESILVQPNSFLAAALSQSAPEQPVMVGAGVSYFSGISAMEVNVTNLDLSLLAAGGVSAFLMERQLGAILYKDVTTSITAGEERILKRRMQDYIQESIASYSLSFVGSRLDVNVTTQTLGGNTSALAGQITQFLQTLKAQERISDYTLDFFSNSTTTDISNGIWKIGLSVELFAPIDTIVFISDIGF